MERALKAQALSWTDMTANGGLISLFQQAQQVLTDDAHADEYPKLIALTGMDRGASVSLMDVRRGSFRLFLVAAALWTALGVSWSALRQDWDPVQILMWGPPVDASWHTGMKESARAADECQFQVRMQRREARSCPPSVELSTSQIWALRGASIKEDLPILMLMWLVPIALIYAAGRTIFWIVNGFRGS